MRALWYIILTSLKNRFLEMLHKPGKLILYLICIGGMVALIVQQILLAPPPMGEQMDPIWLKGIFFALLAIFFLLAVQKGLSNGDVIFEMQDVNLLFVSPISPKTILGYGLIQMTKSAFLAGLFILYMGGTVKRMFGAGFDVVLILFFSFMFMVILFSLLSLVLYNLTNGRARRKRWVKIVTALCFVPLVAVLAKQLLQGTVFMVAVEQTLHAPVLSWTPIVGWGTEGALSFIAGAGSRGILFAAVLLAAGALLFVYILFGNMDYYEDVLVATETSFEKKRAIADGQTNPEALLSGKTKVVKTGLGGAGAATFLYKHLRETTRASVLGVLSWQSIFMILGAGVFAFMLRGETNACLTILQILMWIQIFLIGTGRGIKETMMHYIYLMPERSFQKILWSNLEPVVTVFIQSVLLFGLAGGIGGDALPVIIGSIAVFTLFSLLLIGINYLSMRWFAAELGAGILITLYLLVVLILIAPGVVAAIFAAAAVGGISGTVVGLLILGAWELLVSFGCFALSRGVLHHCDIQTMNK